MLKLAERNILEEALHTCRSAISFNLVFSFISNMLMLMLPIYTLQILDRVISSASTDTLLMLSIITIAAFVALGLLQAVRSFIFIHISEWLDKKLSPEFLKHSITTSAFRSSSLGSQALRDLNTVRSFITGPGINTLFDVPWSLIYIAVIFIVHPINGIIAFSGCIILLALALFNEYATKAPLEEANERSVKSMHQVELATRNAEVIEAMGMMSPIVNNWQKLNREVMALQTLASNRAAVLTGISKIFRLSLQIAIVGVGAYLVLNNELTIGSIIASSILTGRALAPFEAAIGIWKSLVSARKSYHRLKQSLAEPLVVRGTMQLPSPQGKLNVEKVIYTPPGTNRPILKGVDFALEPGEILGLMGPSAAGKTTLAKILTGVWKPTAGNVRLDGADVYLWERNDFGQHMGYLPQDVELFNGTIKENIARMNKEATDEDVVKAAQMANAHDMVLRLPNGYETEIGVGGAMLSAGQRQRLGLARAFYGNPKFIVLDEPNANLDREGEVALEHAFQNAKASGITVIAITHRPSLLTHVDKILILQEGQVAAMGPKDEILSKIIPSKQQNAAAG